MTRAGSVRLRCSRTPACSTTRSTSSGGEHLRQHPDPDPVSQPVTCDYLLPWPRHAAILHQVSLT